MNNKILIQLGVGCLVAAASVQAFINPNFTPLDLIRQSDTILLLRIEKAKSEGAVNARVKETLKGKPGKDLLVVQLTGGAFPEKEQYALSVCRETGEALLFVGEFQSDDASLTGRKGFLHVGNTWLALSEDMKADQWTMEDISDKMQGTWAGSDEMLQRATRYILADKTADIPASIGSSWIAPKAVADNPGKVAGLRGVDVRGTGAADLFVACEGGDRLYRFDAKSGAFKDISGECGLTSKSSAWCWGDFDGNGRLDLASWNGQKLSMLYQQADGKMTGAALNVEGALPPGGCRRMAALTGAEGRQALLASGDDMPFLVQPKPGQAAQVALLPKPAPSTNTLGKTGATLLADFDNDDLPDILLLAQNGGLFFKGTAPGAFAAPIRTETSCGNGRTAAAAGDFDMDGLLDVVALSADRKMMWLNRGGGRFLEMQTMAGEFNYISECGGVDTMTGDINNDGRQDFVVLYESNPVRTFFNRGFFCFGHAVNLVIDRVVPDSAGGQQAGCWADFNGDGALDFCVVLKSGAIRYFQQDLGGPGERPSVAVRLAGGCAGPVRVVAWQEKRCLGAVNVAPGLPVLFGSSEPAPIVLKWRVPNGKPQEKEIFAEGKPAPLVIGNAP